VAGRIAAGEVVERPASVVKELVENSLDAGASRIEVELVDGGRSLVKVSDDGEGMDAEDARLAFERHATSKLSRPEDLDRITSYGFRGEALPSIAAVSRVKLVTCPAGAAEGTEVLCEGGEVSAVRPGPARPGTVVWVRDLFFNTPARREAMGSAAAETARAAEVLAALALAAPGVAVSLRSEGNLLWSTPGTGNLLDAVAALFGAAFARGMVPVESLKGPVRVRGLAGLPAVSRRDGRRQHLVVNGRPVTPRLIRTAVERAYRGLLEAGRTPAFVMALEVPPDRVDVNVHPAKTFVRFRDRREVEGAVYHSLRDALERRDLFAGRLAPAAREPGGQEGDIRGGGVEARETGPLWGLPVPGEVPVGPEASSRPDAVDFGALEPLGQVGGLFIAARGPDGLYLVDQHAAHERVLYERLLAAGQRGERAAQVLVAPETLDLGPGEEEALSSSLEVLRETGFDIAPFGGRTVMVRAVPAALAGMSGARLVADFLDRFGREKAPPGKPPESDRMQAARILASCRAAVKGGEALTLEAMGALLRDLAGCAEPRTCPHGRPTVLKLGLDEIRRRFGRS